MAGWEAGWVITKIGFQALSQLLMKIYISAMCYWIQLSNPESWKKRSLSTKHIIETSISSSVTDFTCIESIKAFSNRLDAQVLTPSPSTISKFDSNQH